MEDKVSDLRVVWAFFLDEKGKEINGFFRLQKLSEGYIQLISGKNILTVPMHRILKIKESLE